MTDQTPRTPAAASMHAPDALQTLHRSRLMRWGYLCLGVLSLVAAIAGVVLPILPTTPFVLLAAACFARSSERFYRALLSHRFTGPIISDWRVYRAMRRDTKRWAALVMVASFGTSMLVMPSFWHRVMLLGMACLLGAFIWRVPVREEHGADSAHAAPPVSPELAPGFADAAPAELKDVPKPPAARP